MSEEKKPYKIEGRPSTIFRVKKSPENPYVMIDRRPIDNPELSFKAKGILTYLMSRPDGWEVNITDLLKHGKDGAAAIRTGLRELRDAHHVCYLAARSLGRITGWIIEVYEVPYDAASPDFDFTGTPQGVEDQIVPDSDFQQVENQQVENRGQVLKNLSNKDLNIGAKSAAMPIDWKLSHGQEITADDLPAPDFDDALAIDRANLIDMQCSGGGALALEFMRARRLIFPESKIKGQRKAARDLLSQNVRPDHIRQAVAELTKKRMTVTDLYSVSKTAVSLAHPIDAQENNPLGLVVGV